MEGRLVCQANCRSRGGGAVGTVGALNASSLYRDWREEAARCRKLKAVSSRGSAGALQSAARRGQVSRKTLDSSMRNRLRADFLRLEFVKDFRSLAAPKLRQLSPTRSSSAASGTWARPIAP